MKWRIGGLLAVLAGFMGASYAYISREPGAAFPVLGVAAGAVVAVIGFVLLHLTRPDPATGFNHPDPEDTPEKTEVR
ncbi:MAG TPA: hypothetical protein PKE40_11895 [Arachnia sp.]|nr:hypothetical protein [Arachnia sp.]HMT87046.1 hypothetical protein [Arachnia sp.]